VKLRFVLCVIDLVGHLRFRFLLRKGSLKIRVLSRYVNKGVFG
jgi:hypothetical protein